MFSFLPAFDKRDDYHYTQASYRIWDWGFPVGMKL